MTTPIPAIPEWLDLGLPVGIMDAGSLSAIAAVAGSFLFVGVDALGADPLWVTAACVAVSFAVRMSSVWSGLGLPEPMALRMPRYRHRSGPLTVEEFSRATEFHAPNDSPIDAIRDGRAAADRSTEAAPEPGDARGGA